MVIRARDLRSNVKEMGFEKGVMHTLELALTQQVEMQQHMRELTDMVARCVDTITTLSQAGEGMIRALEEMKRVHQQGDDDGEHR